MNELPFRGSSSSYSRNIVPRENRATTQDEGPKTKKRKLDDAKTSEQQKSVKMQKLQKAISLSERIVEKHSKEKEQGWYLCFSILSFLKPDKSTSEMFQVVFSPLIKAVKKEPKTNKSSQRSEAIWIVEADSDNDQIQNEDANQPGPSGLQQDKEDAAPVKKPDEEDKAQ